MSVKSLKEMKKSRKTLRDKAVEASQQAKSGNFNKDERVWEPTLDKAGNGYAVIRFLPPPKGEELPWVRIFSHFFRGPGGVYAEKSLTTIGKDDPVSEFNSELWNRGDDEGKEQAREQKRKLNYYANIYVVEDKGNPENNGKVFLYKFGKVIFDKINEAMNPEDEFDDDDVQEFNPFDFWEGANFKLKIRNKDGWRNYDKSEFGKIEPLSEDDEELEEIWSKEYSLEALVDSSEFKSYDELKSKLHRVLGISSSGKGASKADKKEAEPSKQEEKDSSSDEDDVPWYTEEEEKELEEKSGSSEDGDDDLAFFERLAQED